MLTYREVFYGQWNRKHCFRSQISQGVCNGFLDPMSTHLSNVELEIRITSVRRSTVGYLHSPLFTLERVLTIDLWYPRNRWIPPNCPRTSILLPRQRPNEWPGGGRAAEQMDVSETLRPEVDAHPPPWQNSTQ